MAKNPNPAAPSLGDVSAAERFQALETQLREAEEYQAFLAQGVRDFAIVGIDASGRITGPWSDGAHRMLGYESAEVLGQPAAVLFTPEDRAAGLPERELQTAVTAGSAADENWVVRKDGSRFWASGFSAARRAENGALQGFVKIFRDLTERERAQHALRESELRLRRPRRRRHGHLALASANGQADDR